MQIEALDLNFLIRPNSLNFGTVRNCFMLQELIACFWSFPRPFLRFFCMIAYVWLLLLAYDRLTGVWRVELSGVVSVNHLHQQYKASSHFDHIPFISSFYALVSPLKHCMSRIDNMWVLGSSWWGRNLLSCIKPWVYPLCLYLFAMLVDVDWVWVNFHDRCEIVN